MFDPLIAELLAREIAERKANPAPVLAFAPNTGPESEMRRKARQIMEAE